MGRKDVARVVRREALGPRQTDTRLPGLVVDDVDPVEHRRDVGVAQVGQNDLATGPRRQAIEIAFLLRDVVVVGEAIDDADVITAVEQRLDEVRSDEAGSAGDERAHE